MILLITIEINQVAYKCSSSIPKSQLKCFKTQLLFNSEWLYVRTKIIESINIVLQPNQIAKHT